MEKVFLLQQTPHPTEPPSFRTVRMAALLPLAVVGTATGAIALEWFRFRSTVRWWVCRYQHFVNQLQLGTTIHVLDDPEEAERCISQSLAAEASRYSRPLSFVGLDAEWVPSKSESRCKRVQSFLWRDRVGSVFPHCVPDLFFSPCRKGRRSSGVDSRLHLCCAGEKFDSSCVLK